jgi:hypothetical protein
MTPDTFQAPTVVHAHFTIAIDLGSSGEVTVTSAQIASGSAAGDTTPIHHLVSDTDEFTSMPLATTPEGGHQ